MDFLRVGFVGDEVAGEDFDHAFGGAHHRSHVQADMNRARYQTFPLDLVAGQPNSKDRPDDRNRFDEALGDAPATSPNNSAFQ